MPLMELFSGLLGERVSPGARVGEDSQRTLEVRSGEGSGERVGSDAGVGEDSAGTPGETPGVSPGEGFGKPELIKSEYISLPTPAAAGD